MNNMREYPDEHLWYMEGVRKVISPLRKDLQFAPRSGAPAVFMARGPSHAAQDKRGHVGAWEPTLVMPTQCPTNNTYSNQSLSALK
jgi:hypothetical protein